MTPGEIAQIPFPGKIAIANAAGFQHGCLAIRLESIEALNQWAADNARCLIVHMERAGEGFIVLYTKRLSAEQEADFEEVTREVNVLMNERRLKRAEQETTNQLAREAAAREQLRLAELGGKYERRVKQIRALADGKTKKEAFKALNSGDLGPTLGESGAESDPLPQVPDAGADTGAQS